MKAKVVIEMSPDRYQALRELECAARNYGLSVEWDGATDESVGALLTAAEKYTRVAGADQ